MEKSFALSEVSKSRLTRHNAFSLTCVALAIALYYLTQNLLILLSALYYLAAYSYRKRILMHANPYLQVSDTGLKIRWVRDTFIPWAAITKITVGPNQAIWIHYTEKSGSPPRSIHIAEWRLENGADAFIQAAKQAKKRCSQ